MLIHYASYRATPKVAYADITMRPMPNLNRRRILLDLSTSLQWRGKHAVGIVRTEREIAKRLLVDPDLDVLPVIFNAGRFLALDPVLAEELITVDDRTEPQAIPEVVPKPLQKNRTVSPLRLLGAAARFIARTLVELVPAGGREDFRLALVHLREVVRKILYGSPKSDDPQAAPVAERPIDLRFVVDPSDNDVLFLGGLGWDVIDCRSVAAIKRQSGMKVVSIMYDLIPTKMPHFLGGNPKDYFLNYFLHMVDLSDHIFCISQTTQSDLVEFCNLNNRTCPPASVIYLGSNIPALPDPRGIQPDEIRDRLSRGRFALAVGTFEVRKNYAFLLSLWEDLLEDPEFDLDLVIAGMPGWGVDDILAKLEASPHFGKRIFWFKRLSDGGISWLYEKCQVFVFPSLYEGWGLPVIEALQHGKPVIASNRGSVPEAGLGVAKILDVCEPEAWKDEIRRHAVSRVTLPPNIPLPTWEDAALTVKSTLVGLK
ncbi:glycosyltransferase family 1 protein [Chelativorans sp. J32]|uniref:glycosyltransferase family 4 protein n=1 Tax=Chelativorans sp. J32 TaxID=935840 RepID=UPI0004B9FBBA|nr:glycosyltransferase family 1 protein [Chelativorans sp. J32]